MKNFNMKRFSQMLRYDFKTGIRPMIWFSTGMVVLFLLVFMSLHSLQNMSNIGGKEPAYLTYTIAHEAAVMGCVIIDLFWWGVACTLFRDVQKKAPRTSMLMLPATNLEKFLSRWVYMLAFSVIGSFVAFFVADMLHLGWLAATGRTHATSASQVFDYFMKNDKMFYSLFFTFHAFGLLCGVLFKKFHIVVTAVVGVILFAVFMQVCSYITPYETREIICLVAAIIATITFTILAYRLFCRWQVVTRKFVNL
jgi:hypothetical protein